MVSALVLPSRAVVAETTIGAAIPVGMGPFGVAVNPTTHRVYVANSDSNSVSVIDGATNTVVGSPIAVGTTPIGVGVNSKTNRIYVGNYSSNTVSVIDGVTNTVISSSIQVGSRPFGVGINPAINRVYVSNSTGNTLSVIDGATNTVVGSPITVASGPVGVGVDPTTNRVSVANHDANTVTVIGVPLGVSASTAPPGGAVSASWSSLFGPGGADFVGLFEPGAPNTSPRSRLYTNGTASPGGAGVAVGSVSLPIPAGLVGGIYDVRLISGASGGILAQTTVTVTTSPVAVDDAYTVAAGSTLTVAAPGVLANDTDPDVDATAPALKVAVVTNPAHGTVSLQSNGAFSYTPTGSFAGTESFTYRVTDHANQSATATVSITVAAVPVAVNDTYTVSNGSSLTISAPGVLANDTDVDSPTLQTTVATDPAHGTLSLESTGSFVYTPNPSFAGADGFTYRATDKTGLSATGIVSITVNPVACGPRPTVSLQTAVASGALQVTVVAADVDGPMKNQVQELRFGAPLNGRVILDGQSQTSAFTHTPPAGTARVSFSVQRVTPGQATTVPLTVVDRCGTWPTFVGGGTSSGF